MRDIIQKKGSIPLPILLKSSKIGPTPPKPLFNLNYYYFTHKNGTDRTQLYMLTIDDINISNLSDAAKWLNNNGYTAYNNGYSCIANYWDSKTNTTPSPCTCIYSNDGSYFIMNNSENKNYHQLATGNYVLTKGTIAKYKPLIDFRQVDNKYGLIEVEDELIDELSIVQNPCYSLISWLVNEGYIDTKLYKVKTYNGYDCSHLSVSYDGKNAQLRLHDYLGNVVTTIKDEEVEKIQLYKGN